MPRRKYGRLRKPVPPPKKEEKCRYCKLGWPCPAHGGGQPREREKKSYKSSRRF